MIGLYDRSGTFHADATINGERVRLSLGTRTSEFAKRLVSKLEIAILEGPDSPRWSDLRLTLPGPTFLRFARLTGVKEKWSPTWKQFRELFESDMNRRVKFNELRVNTVLSYKRLLSMFERFLDEKQIKHLKDIEESVIEDFKTWRFERIRHRNNSTGRSTLGLDVDMLHHLFCFAVKKEWIKRNPVHFMARTMDPANGAQPYTEDELRAMRNHLREQDWFLFLLLRWTGFRSSDAVTLLWREVDLDREVIEHVCKKNRKKVTIPISDELLNAFKKEHERRRPRPNEPVLSMAELEALKRDSGPRLFAFKADITDEPLSNSELLSLGKQVYRFVVALGKRAGVCHAYPHRFRTTYAVDMLKCGETESGVARVLGDTLETVMKHYLPYVPVLQEQTRSFMNTGKGIEDRSRLTSQQKSV
jgi:integrase